MYRQENLKNVSSRLNRDYSIWQETETSRIELYDSTMWLVLVDTFRNENEFYQNYGKSIENYELKEIGNKFISELNNYKFNYKDGFVQISENVVLYNGKLARECADFWGDMSIRKSVKNRTIYLENDRAETFIIHNGNDIINYLNGNTEKLRKAKSVFDCSIV